MIQRLCFPFPPLKDGEGEAGFTDSATSAPRVPLFSPNLSANSSMPDPLVQRLKQMIITTLKIEEFGADDIDETAPLVNCGIQFDSIDSLELAVQLEREFGIKVSTNEGTKITYGSVVDLAAFLRERVPVEKLQ